MKSCLPPFCQTRDALESSCKDQGDLFFMTRPLNSSPQDIEIILNQKSLFHILCQFKKKNVVGHNYHIILQGIIS